MSCVSTATVMTVGTNYFDGITTNNSIQFNRSKFLHRKNLIKTKFLFHSLFPFFKKSTNVLNLGI